MSRRSALAVLRLITAALHESASVHFWQPPRHRAGGPFLVSGATSRSTPTACALRSPIHTESGNRGLATRPTSRRHRAQSHAGLGSTRLHPTGPPTRTKRASLQGSQETLPDDCVARLTS